MHSLTGRRPNQPAIHYEALFRKAEMIVFKILFFDFKKSKKLQCMSCVPNILPAFDGC